MISGGLDITKHCNSLPLEQREACIAYANRCVEQDSAKLPIVLDLPNGMTTREFTLDECLKSSVDIAKIFGPPPVKNAPADTQAASNPASSSTPAEAPQIEAWAQDGKTRLSRRFHIRVSQLKTSGEFKAPQVLVVRKRKVYHLDEKLGFRAIQYAINTAGDGSKKTFTYRTNWYGGSYEGVVEFSPYENAFDIEIRIQLAGELGPAQFIHIVRP